MAEIILNSFFWIFWIWNGYKEIRGIQKMAYSSETEKIYFHIIK
jgi:hypothetical protein